MTVTIAEMKVSARPDSTPMAYPSITGKHTSRFKVPELPKINHIVIKVEGTKAMVQIVPFTRLSVQEAKDVFQTVKGKLPGMLRDMGYSYGREPVTAEAPEND